MAEDGGKPALTEGESRGVVDGVLEVGVAHLVLVSAHVEVLWLQLYVAWSIDPAPEGELGAHTPEAT